MGFGISTFLVAVGAVLRFAISRTRWQDINIHAVGDILMVVGVLGLLVSLIAMTTGSSRRRRVVVADDPSYEEIVQRRI